MNVIYTIIKESGFCNGVKSAINRANANFTGIENGEKVYLYGDLVNNSHVMGQYREKNFLVTNDVGSIEPGSTVIIRAHGVPKAVCENLRQKGVTVEDCTCPRVKNIHKIVAEESEEGSTIIIVGKKEHPEVVGIRGWCKNNNAVVLETEADLNGVNWNAPVCAVGQTTCKKEWWSKACELILQKYPSAKIYNTLCNFTTNRSERAARIAASANAMIIVGDKKSANSVELFSACKNICANTVFISSLKELLAMEMKNLPEGPKIGLVGSASTPAEKVEEIYEYLLFANFLTETKLQIENFAEEKMKNLIAESAGKPFLYEAVRDLHEQNRDGKRIRGAMIRLGEKIAGENTEDFLPVAAAYEMFQTAILIHDDIIDRSEARRGRQTIHAKTYASQLAKGSEQNFAAHFGISRALCVGDYGLFLSNNILANAPICASVKAKIFQQFSEIQVRTLEGEIMDVSLPAQPINIEENFEGYMDAVYEIYRAKTAWYTLAGPLIIGAVCGGAEEKLLHELEKIALPLGIAFQIKDDLLGMYACDKILGKPAISDMEEKKQTLLYGFARKNATEQQKNTLNKLYGKQNASLKDLETVRDIFTLTGAKKFAEDKINELSHDSLNLIEQTKINDEHKILLRGLVSYLITREY